VLLKTIKGLNAEMKDKTNEIDEMEVTANSEDLGIEISERYLVQKKTATGVSTFF